MPRARNPRRQALDSMREMSGWIRTMLSIWDQSGKVSEIERDGNGRAINHRWRPIRPDERHENNIERWEQLDSYMNGVMVRAEELREFAQARIAELRAKEEAGVR